jgi:subtilisin family serine protease
MRKYFLVSVVAVAFLSFTVALVAPRVSGAADGEPGDYIVIFNDDVAQPYDATVQVAGEHGLTVSHAYRHVIKGFAASVPAGRLNALKNDPRVAFVSDDGAVFANAKPSAPAPVQPPQSLPTGIDRVNAEAKANQGAGIEVAVIDTGIDLAHPDLKGNILGGKNCVLRAKSYADDNGHGTHVAGTIAALDNGIGAVGVAPGAMLWSVKVLDKSGNGTWSSIICGLDFVASKAPVVGGSISVANMSLSGGGVSDGNCGNTNNDALHKAVCRARDAGVTVVVAAGNSGADAAKEVPAAYDDAVIAVSALADSDGQPDGLGAATSYGPDDTFASFSNWGLPVDIGAPGVAIYSTWKGSSYNTISGTSMASPHVAGAAALYLAAHPGAAWSEVRDALKASGEALGAGHTDPSGLHPEPVLRADSL